MGRPTAGLESTAPWLALLIAFSPVLIDLAHELARVPEERVVLLAPVLLVLALRGEGAREPGVGHRDGSVAIAIGAALEILGIVSGSWSIARLGLPVAALGLARLRGAPRMAVIALAFFAVPPPYVLVSLTSPMLETALSRAAAALLAGVGIPIEAVGPTLVAAAGAIHVLPHHGGATLAVALAALGWYSAARAGAGIGVAALRAAIASLLALPAQLLVLLVAGALVGLGLPGAGKFWLRNVAWIVTSAIGLAWIHRQHLFGSEPQA